MTDWLSRKVRGVVDFRLPGDLYDIPSSVLGRRMGEYLMQERARILAQNAQAPGVRAPQNGDSSETLTLF